MSIQDKLLQGAAAAPGGITPSEHFGVVLYEGDSKSGRSVNGGKYGAGATFGIEKSTTQATDSRITTTYYAKNVGSISGWLKKNGNTSELEYVFVTKDDTGSAHQLGINLLQEGDSDLSARVGNGSSTTNVNTSGLTLNNDAWHHYVVTWNLPNGSNNVKVYVDGSLQATGSQSTGSWTGNSSRTFQLGHYTNTNTNNGFAGMQDQVRVFEKELSSSEVSTLYAETVDTVTSLDPLSEDTTDTLQVLGDTSCIAAYKFDNNEDDLSGNYDGTGSEIQYATGRYGQAASFNNTSSSKMVIGAMNSVIPNYTTGVSFSFWVYLDTINTGADYDHWFVGQEDYGGAFSNGEFSVRLYEGKVYTDYAQSGSIYRQRKATTVLSTGQWYHIVATYDTSNANITEVYLNGVLETSSNITSGGTFTTTALMQSSSNMSVGGGPTGTDGKIDQFRIFTKVLSASEVTTLYQENSLIASYRFEGNSNDDRGNFNGSDNDITYEFGLNFTPDFVWAKRRSAAEDNAIFDTSRGVQKQITANKTNAESTKTNAISSFDSGGFTTGANNALNTDGEDYVAWCFKANGGTTSSNTDGTTTSTVQANTDAGFSIISYTGTSASSQSVGHNLSSAPEIVFFKSLSTTDGWIVWYPGAGTDRWLEFNSSNAYQTGATWGGVPTSTVVHLQNGPSARSSGNGNNYIAYAFHSIDSFSKIGTYTGNGSANGPIVETGFEPAFLIVKRTSNTADWIMLDNKRNLTNPKDKYLFANSSDAEGTSTRANFLSNGFQVITTGANMNFNGDNYIYMAFAADPDTEAPAVAKSFSTVTYTGNGSSDGPILDIGFNPGLVWLKARQTTSTGDKSHRLHDVIRGQQSFLKSDTQDTASSSGDRLNLNYSDTQIRITNASDGWNDSGYDYVAWTWKADDNEPTLFGGPARAVYKFEDNANDVTGDYNGTASNVSYVTGKFNKAADFNGTNSKITFSTGFSQQTSFTVSFWLKTSQYNDDHTIFQFEGDSNENSNRIGLFASGTEFGFYPHNTTGGAGRTSISTSDSSALYDGNWHHVALVVDGTSNTSAKIYIDGVSKTLTTYESYTTTMRMTGNMRIGGRKDDASGEFMDGEIDQLRIYNGAVSDIGVAALYAETTSDNDDLTLGAPKETIISANANAGFSIVKYEGDDDANRLVPHGLSSAPEMIILKNLDATRDWIVWHTSLDSGKNVALNSTAAQFTVSSGTSYGGLGTPTASNITFIQGTSNLDNVNDTGANYIAYCFHSVSGYSKFGYWQGGTTTINIGFRADFVLYQDFGAGGSWNIVDSVRDDDVKLLANTDDAESSQSLLTITDTGFTVTSESSVVKRLYMAFKIN